jgi:aspartate 1-decarboxylase
VPEDAARSWKPRCVFVDERNRPIEERAEHGGQADLSNAWQ